MPYTVQTLTVAMAAGDARAVEAFYRQYFELMYRHACNITGRDESFCLDVVQDAVLRVIRAVRPANSEAQLATWLRLVTQTAAYDLLKAESRRRRRQTRVALAVGPAGQAAEASPDDEDRIAWLRQEISSLDPQIARLIELRYEKQWTLARIAESLGLSVGTVDGRLRRALGLLRSRRKGATMSEPLSLLSFHGEQRRQRILRLALAAARVRRRRRVLIRTTLAALLAAALIPWILRTVPPHEPGIAIQPVAPLPRPVPAPTEVARIENDPHIIERLTIPPQASHVIVINDTELLTDLALADRPAGLAYVNGKATLVYR